MDEEKQAKLDALSERLNRYFVRYTEASAELAAATASVAMTQHLTGTHIADAAEALNKLRRKRAALAITVLRLRADLIETALDSPFDISSIPDSI